MRRLIKTPAVIARARSARSNLTLLLILLSIAVATPISAEEIRLTTIVPDQTILRAKKGAIGDNYSNPDPLTGGISNNSIPTSALLVEGSIGIGNATPHPDTKLDVDGRMRLAPTTQPASQQPGMIYYDSIANTMRYYKGGSSPGWVDIGGGGGGGTFTTNGMFSVDKNILMTAESDGIVVAYANECSAIAGWSTYNPNRALVIVAKDGNGNTSGAASITFPVREGDDWKVTASTWPNAYYEITFCPIK